jgi:hypothetical protein
MRGSRGPRGFPRKVVRQYLGAVGSTAYDLPHRGVLRESVRGYDGDDLERTLLCRGTGTDGADEILFVEGATTGDAYATYTYIPGWRGEE